MALTEVDTKALHKRYWEEGISLKELGESVGMSHEGVRQTFKRAKLPLRTRARSNAARRARSIQRAKDHKERIEASYRELGNIERVSEALGLPYLAVKKIVNEMKGFESYQRRGPSERVYTDDFLDECLRRAGAATDGPLTLTKYRQFAKAEGLPTDATIVKYRGPWPEACKRVGVQANPPLGLRVTPEDCYQSVLKCVREKGRRVSFDEYDAWARGRADVPSGGTVRNKVGWSAAIIRALEEVG